MTKETYSSSMALPIRHRPIQTQVEVHAIKRCEKRFIKKSSGKSVRSKPERQLKSDLHIQENLRMTLSSAIDIAHIGPWEYDIAKDLFVFNDHFYKMYRTSYEKVGAYTMSSGEYAQRFVHPDEINIVSSEISKAREASSPDFSRHFEHRIVFPDGTIGHIAVKYFIQKDNLGNTVKTYGVNQDITEQKQYEAILRQRTAELEYRNKAFKDLAHKTIIAMENDRRVLAKELHDSIGGTLAAIRYHLEARVEKTGPPPPSVDVPLEKIIDYLGNAIGESRRITKQLRPSVLDDFGIVAAITELIRDFEAFHPNMKTLLRISFDEEDLSIDIRTVLYRVLQEALNNAGKHSKADFVNIRIHRYRDWVRLVIKDNGVGIDRREIARAAKSMTGYGLHSMRERVELCRGTFRIESAPGEGTMIIASIPLNTEDA